ncbi:class A beta-lactamase [Edaphobacter bradus]|uniref:class A beta-lactamase n=1 Tax=Edaphobacter bradus TaxID=2259016 RepID=UPI0021DF4C81|nr:class A beta-lactamase [Edaphobacter bradus]
MVTRRSALVSLLIGSLSPRLLIAGPGSALPDPFLAIEQKSRGRLGCAVLDTGSGKRIGYHADERFPMCSTFKFLAAALILKRAEQGHEHLDRLITFTKADLLAYAPVTQQHLADGMTIAQLCEAAITLSDNTAANLLLASFGGPPAFNAFLRSIGDSVTRLDRIEPSLNEAVPGDPRDTTTPSAMLDNMHRVLFGDVLSFDSRTLLTNWLLANKTGDARLRAGLPHDWRAGDKTGSGERGTTNDIAVLWPPHRAPVLVTAYLTGSKLDSDGRNAILADAGRAVVNTIQPA